MKQYYVSCKIFFSLLVDAENEDDALIKAKDTTTEDLTYEAESAIYADNYDFNNVEEVEK